MRRLLTPLVVAVVLATALAHQIRRADAQTAPTLKQMVGQLMLVRMHGQAPSSSFLGRIRRGEIGGVVLYNDNFDSNGPASLIAKLQAVARAAKQPPLLIAIDQEGGIVKRLQGAPSLAPPQMRSATIAEAQGLATARSLKPLGINVDLAPVLDVGHGGFITPRTFGTTAAAVAARGPAFAAGLARGQVLATAKHFPGLGHASLNTDTTVAKVTTSEQQLRIDWTPFRRAINDGIPLVMMSTAVYPALGSTWPAAVSPNIVTDLRQLGFTGVIVTDALQTPAVNKFMSTAKAAVEAIYAGDDIVLAAGPSGNLLDTDGASTAAYKAVMAAAQSGQITQRTLAAAYARILALKKEL